MLGRVVTVVIVYWVISPLGMVGGIHVSSTVEELVAITEVMVGASPGTGEERKRKRERERERERGFNHVWHVRRALCLLNGSLVVYGKTDTLLSYHAQQ